MRALVIALASALLAVAVAAHALARAEGRPALQLKSRQPLTVAGQAFRARERVRVSFLGELQRRERVRASTRGSFVVVFEQVFVTRCDAVRVVAVGKRGSRAILKILPSPACLPE